MMIGSTVVAALFPARCPGCGARAEPLCPACAATVRPAPTIAVPALDEFVAALAYEGVARELIARVKYRNERAALPWLAAAMVAALRARAEGLAVVTWVPASARRRRGSGFDHGELLARAVTRRLRLPAVALLVRGPGPPQTGASRADRRAGPPVRAKGAPGPIGAVLLVDDVVTTGATLTAAARALRRAGAPRVVGCCAAATPPPGSAPEGTRSDLRILTR